MKSRKQLFIFEIFSSSKPKLIGTVFKFNTKNGLSMKFFYDREYLEKNEYRLVLDPGLSLYDFAPVILPDYYKNLLSDSNPDGFGRRLIRKKELISCYREKRAPYVNDFDLLQAIPNTIRTGAIIFNSENSLPKLKSEVIIPSTAHLSILDRLACNFESDEAFRNEKDFNLLFDCASSLGGSVPKVNVRMSDGSVWIAKFRSAFEDNDARLYELVCTELAKSCGIEIPETSSAMLEEGRTILLSKRFDRTRKGYIHAVCAKSLVMPQQSSKTVSYLDIAAFIRKYGAKPKEDLKQLYLRICFDILASNTNDSLHKYYFLLKKSGWKLAPAFGIKCDPNGGFLSICIDKHENYRSKDLLLSNCKHFGLSASYGDMLFENVKNTLKSSWRDLCDLYGLDDNMTKDIKNALSLCYE